MSEKHITEETLQEILFEGLNDDVLKAHLDHCTICQLKIENYRTLSKGMEQSEEESFKFDVTMVVMDKIAHYEHKKQRSESLLYWGIISIVLAVLIFAGLPFLTSFLHYFQSFTSITTFFSLGTCVLIIAFFSIDLFKRYKRKEALYFEQTATEK